MRRPLEKTSREGVSVKFFPSEKNGKSIVTAKLYDTNGVKIIGAQASVTVGNGIDKDMAKVYARNRALKKLDAMRRPDGPETTTEECSIERAFRDITDKLSLAPPEMKSRETREAAIVYFENNVLPLLRKMTANSFAPGYVRVMMFDAMLHRKKYTAVYVERGLDQMILDFAEYGYAQQLGVYNLVREGGTEVLRKTYQHRLEKYCGVTQQTDEGAWLFLLHRSLSRSVQADHYRGFTSESGRRCMLSYVQQDRRFLKKQKRIIDSKGMKSGRTVHRIWPADDENEQIISLELVMDDSVDADELIKVYAENGLFLSVEEIED